MCSLGNARLTVCSLGNARLGYIPVALFLIVALAITCTVDLERGELAGVSSIRVRVGWRVKRADRCAQEYTKHSRLRQLPRRLKGTRMKALRKNKSIIRC